MKNRRIFPGVATLLLGSGVVSVSLSVSLGQTPSKQQNSPVTATASSSDKPSQATPPVPEKITPGSFLANPLDLERVFRAATIAGAQTSKV